MTKHTQINKCKMIYPGHGSPHEFEAIQAAPNSPYGACPHSPSANTKLNVIDCQSI